MSPRQMGSAYVLLHHVMGEAAGKKGVWAYVEGGMGAVSEAIASSAVASGAEIITNATVSRILVEQGRAIGVQMSDGSEVRAKTIVAGVSPYHTFMELMPQNKNILPHSFTNHIRHTGSNHSFSMTNINMIVYYQISVVEHSKLIVPLIRFLFFHVIRLLPTALQAQCTWVPSTSSLKWRI